MAEPTNASSTGPEEGFSHAPDGARIAWRRWTPDGTARGSVVVLHGVGEHGGRYGDVAAQMTDAGYAVTAMDFRGFGRSSGRRGDGQLGPTLGDIDRAIDEERDRTGGGPVFLYGHSLGGLVAFLYGIDRQPDLAGMVLTGPAFHTVIRDQPLKMALAKYVGRLLPGLTIPSGLPVEQLNRDPAVVAAYLADPLVHDRGTLRFATEAFAAMDRVNAEVEQFRLPLLIAHGGADSINMLSGSQAIADRLPDLCTLTVYDGVYHAVEHEPEQAQIIEDVLRWMDEHLAPRSLNAVRQERGLGLREL